VRKILATVCVLAAFPTCHPETREGSSAYREPIGEPPAGARQTADSTPLLPQSRVQSVRLVDSVMWRAFDEIIGADSGVQFRVEVVTDVAVDTIPDVLVLRPPVMMPDSLSVSGVAVGEFDIPNGIYTYTPNSRSVDLNAHPGPAYHPFSEPALSPDGTHLAYLGNRKDERFWLVVITWPECTLIYEGVPIDTHCTEFWANVTRWVDTDSVELYMNLCWQNTWARAAGSVSTLKFAVDSVGIDVLRTLEHGDAR
jgi:hypothetical protein